MTGKSLVIQSLLIFLVSSLPIPSSQCDQAILNFLQFLECILFCFWAFTCVFSLVLDNYYSSHKSHLEYGFSKKSLS